MKDTVFFCPACGSPSVDASSLAGGSAICRACPWSGSREELATVAIEHDALSQEAMVIKFVNVMAQVFASSSAHAVGQVLIKWGFLEGSSIPEDLAAYMKGAAIAATKSVLETRQHLERARVNKLRAKNAS